jgi:hypothetical protein
LVRAGIERSPAITEMLHELRALRGTSTELCGKGPAEAGRVLHPEVEAG